MHTSGDLFLLTKKGPPRGTSKNTCFAADEKVVIVGGSHSGGGK